VAAFADQLPALENCLPCFPEMVSGPHLGSDQCPTPRPGAQRAGKRSRPIAAILDSQSVKSDPHGGEVGYDAGKRIKGSKRHLLVDTLGLILGIFVTPASTPEGEGGQGLLEHTLGWLAWPRLLWVVGGYTGNAFAEWVKTLRPKLEVEVVKRSDDTSGFKVLPRRWVVETFAWLMRHRRLVRDYKTTEISAEAWAYYREDTNPTPPSGLIPQKS
jgi:transposase